MTAPQTTTGKVYNSAAAAVADIPSGATLAVSGFGLCGIPMRSSPPSSAPARTTSRSTPTTAA